MPYPQSRTYIGMQLAHRLLRLVLSLLGFIIAIFAVIWVIFLALNPNGPDPLKHLESELWIATSKSWPDRVSCHNIGICGGVNWLMSTRIFKEKVVPQPPTGRHSHGHDWIDSDTDAVDWSEEEQSLREIPPYVIEHAPLLYLHQDEQWWPTDVADFLHHVKHQRLGRESSNKVSLPLLESMIARESEVDKDYLQSVDDPESLPNWLTSPQNIPLAANISTSDENSPQVDTLINNPAWGYSATNTKIQSPQRISQTLLPPTYRTNLYSSEPKGLRSTAPAFLISVKKANDTIDAFWFFFYGFNRGARVTGIQYGNHVGDWEHIMIRFQKGKPVLVYLSAHEWGSAYKYDVLEKASVDSARIVVYAGLGSHAHYATTGRHSYALPMSLLGDDCSAGYLWDPTLNLISYTYTPNAASWPKTPKFRSSMLNPMIRSMWLEYKGRWGDPKYSLGDERGRNYRFAGEYKYLSGPTGPWDKNLNREDVCEHPEKPCIIRDTIDGYVGPIKGASEIESFSS